MCVCVCVQTVDMHREKVARREIGAFTVAKRYSRSHKVIPPAPCNEPKPKYSRTPISYSSLDTLGHGMKVHTHTHRQYLTYKDISLFPPVSGP